MLDFTERFAMVFRRVIMARQFDATVEARQMAGECPRPLNFEQTPEEQIWSLIIQSCRHV
jgi:hypothetical protein